MPLRKSRSSAASNPQTVAGTLRRAVRRNVAGTRRVPRAQRHSSRARRDPPSGCPSRSGERTGLVPAPNTLQLKDLAVQGNITPGASDFPSHAVVVVGTTIYDPSYGSLYNSYKTLSDNLFAWETTSLAYTVYYRWNSTTPDHWYPTPGSPRTSLSPTDC